MDANLVMDSCVDFNEDTNEMSRIPFKILIDDEKMRKK